MFSVHRCKQGDGNAGEVKLAGETFEACRDAVEKGLQLPNAPYVANASPSIDKVNRPLNFHWTTTVALDGTVTNTPMVIEQPQ